MWDALSLLDRWLVRPDVHTPVEIARIDGDDFTIELQCEPDRGRSLPHRSRPDDRNDRFWLVHRVAPLVD